MGCPALCAPVSRTPARDPPPELPCRSWTSEHMFQEEAENSAPGEKDAHEPARSGVQTTLTYYIGRSYLNGFQFFNILLL